MTSAGISGGKLATRTFLLPKVAGQRLTLDISPVPCLYIAVPCVRSCNAVKLCVFANFTNTCLLGPSIWFVVTSFSFNRRCSYITVREHQSPLFSDFLYRRYTPLCFVAHTCYMFKFTSSQNTKTKTLCHWIILAHVQVGTEVNNTARPLRRLDPNYIRTGHLPNWIIESYY
jgi:hypothetical protein